MLQLPSEAYGGGETELHLHVLAPVERVFSTFTDIERWPQISEVYKHVRWLADQPWRVGSDFETRMVWPLEVTVRHVVLRYEPPHEVRWLVHGIGIVIERWTRFIPYGENTELVTSAIFIGQPTERIPGEVGDLLPQYTRRFYEDVKAASEQPRRNLRLA